MKIYKIYDQLTTGVTLFFGSLLIVFQFFPELKGVNQNRIQDNWHILQKASLVSMNDTIPILHQGRSIYRSRQDDLEYLLKIDGGRIISFKVNGRNVARKDYNRYRHVIMALQENSHPVPKPSIPHPPLTLNTSLKSVDSFEDQLTDKLMMDGLIKSEEDYSFELTLKKMVLDGEVVTKEMLNNYIRFLETIKGEKITIGSSYSVIKRP